MRAIRKLGGVICISARISPAIFLVSENEYSPTAKFLVRPGRFHLLCQPSQSLPVPRRRFPCKPTVFCFRLMAAFTSRSFLVWHAGHLHSRTPSLRVEHQPLPTHACGTDVRARAHRSCWATVGGGEVAGQGHARAGCEGRLHHFPSGGRNKSVAKYFKHFRATLLSINRESRTG